MNLRVLTMSRRAAVFGCAAVAWSACDWSSDRTQGTRAQEDTLRLSSTQVGADTLFLDVAQIIGHRDGDPEYLFGAVSSFAVDGQGRVYVGDRTNATVRAFDTDGTFLGTIARRGGGPGEIIDVPANLLFGADGRLYVRDGARVTVFGRRADAPVPDSVVAVWNTPGGGNTTSSPSTLARDGRYFYPGGRFLPNQLPRYFNASLRDGEPDGDTLQVPAYAGLTRLRPALLRLGVDALMLPGLNRVPFSAVPVWDVTPAGTLISSDGTSSVLLETNAAGDTVRRIQLPESHSRPIPARWRADSTAALEDRIAKVPGDLSQVTGLGEGVEAKRLPDSLPALIGLTVAQDGTIWVEEWPSESQTGMRIYQVLKPGGRFKHVVVLRAPLVRDPAPFFGERCPAAIVGLLRDDATGVERVARFDLP